MRKRHRIALELRPSPALSYERLSDPVLVQRAKDGDGRALDALLARYRPRAERLARHMLRDPDDASDATQEAFAKVCVRLQQFRGGAQFSTWLHRLVVNTCLDAVERRRTRMHEPLGDQLASDDDPARTARNSELRRELCDALAGVSPAQAQVVLLKDALGYSFEEIAEASGMPVGTAKCHAHRGRARLSERLEHDAA
ncbi:MAG TPA: sigma-70 family RNA polymerase sigma factor [Gaiellaceae bacterium]|nr:sigma-70 family RNA polymerase sigma factor [Gaiellaceae bacterium]